MLNRFQEALSNKEFVVTWELVPGRGSHEDAQNREIDEGKQVFASNAMHAISITDNPGGNPALLADAVAEELHAQDITTLVHFTCKDRSRNQIAAQLYAMERRGISNLLVMTGDYPSSGWQGRSRPVFDLDPIQVLQMIGDMNKGLAVTTPRGVTEEKPTHFFGGAVVNPFKWTEAEVLTQYFKMEKKIAAGAQFLIAQIGYDARKMQEPLLYLKRRRLAIPVLANIYVISAGVARYMKAGNVPGCYISDEFMDVLAKEAEAEDKGKHACHLRAAKMIAVARGLGYAGVHIGGSNLNSQIVEEILLMAQSMQDDWRRWAEELCFGQSEGFYLYEPIRDAAGRTTGFNSDKESPRIESRGGAKILRNYGISRFFHYWLLTKEKRGYGVLKRVMAGRERRKGRDRSHTLEHLGKSLIYHCMDCGDCGLEATVYNCPMSQCPKCQRNGPCGGSSNGWCEVYPNERYCIYFKAYHRLKKYHETEKLNSFITPPNNWDFFETSGWGNYTHERDNAARRQFINENMEEK
jgi:methylenetetrahydrofolate reductase (NADPH)